MCATACFDIGYKVSDICDNEGNTVVVVASMSTTDVWRGMMYC